jgi:hypothetical protein
MHRAEIEFHLQQGREFNYSGPKMENTNTIVANWISDRARKQLSLHKACKNRVWLRLQTFLYAYVGTVREKFTSVPAA